MGVVDEVNCHLGVAVSLTTAMPLKTLIEQIQQLLFDLGADLCCPIPEDAAADRCPRISERQIVWLEKQIDLANERLDALTSFVLPGGATDAAALHLARSVCRRSELEFCALVAGDESGRSNPQVGIFLNRLSDLLFVLARQANSNGNNDVLWSPGRIIPDTDQARPSAE
jgi:cob(I)alamin adenosyltransferase